MTAISVRALAIALAAFAVAPAFAEPTNYKVDPVHSSVLFRIQHMGAANFYGRFKTVEGAVVFDEADASKSSINLTIKADSIDTANPKRDEHAKGPDFLNVVQFPEISFKSTAVKKVDDKNFELTGDLTF